jgi:hypothetical protein
VARERAVPAADRVVRAGPATLVVPRQWRTVAPGVTGLDMQAAPTVVMAPWRDVPDRVIVTVAPAGDASLLPGALRRLVRDLGQGPSPTRLAGYRAWRYAGLLGRDGNVLDVTVLPTGTGVLAVACTSPPWEAGAMANCASSIRSVSLIGTVALVPARDPALRLRLPAVLAALDRSRVRGRAALGRAATGAGQARLAHRLADAHLAAADSLRPVEGRAGQPLVRELSEVADAYSALARAASAGSAPGFQSAREDVATAEARLTRVIAPFHRRQAAAVQPPPSPPTTPATRAANTLWIMLALVAFLGLLAAGLATLRACGRRARRAATDPAPAAPSSHPAAPAQASTAAAGCDATPRELSGAGRLVAPTHGDAHGQNS